MWKTYLSDAGVVLSLLTRIPLRIPGAAFERSNQAVWAYGLAGVVWAIVVWSISMIALTLGLGQFIAAPLGLGCWYYYNRGYA
jgi:cobalamin synthase